MNKIIALIVATLLSAGCAQVAPPPPPGPIPPPPIVATPKVGVVDMPASVDSKNTEVKQQPVLTVQVYPGSLKENIERIAAHYGWHQVVWDAPQDFRWVGHAQIQGRTLAIVLSQLLNDYPLQAVFYQGNHVLYIHSRTLR